VAQASGHLVIVEAIEQRLQQGERNEDSLQQLARTGAAHKWRKESSVSALL
jgi:hypothetical protein